MNVFKLNNKNGNFEIGIIDNNNEKVIINNVSIVEIGCDIKGFNTILSIDFVGDEIDIVLNLKLRGKLYEDTRSSLSDILLSA